MTMNNRDNVEQIRLLTDRFFDGMTTPDEERLLYAFFASADVPPELEDMREMFLDFAAMEFSDDDISAAVPADTAAPVKPAGPSAAPVRRLSLWRIVAGAAAVVLLVVGIGLTGDLRERRQLAAVYEGSYMIVDGKRVDDLRKIHTHIESALEDADRIEQMADGGSDVIRDAERDLLDNISDPQERERIRRLMQ